MKYTLFGDGIHDDTAAIQEMLNSYSEVILPAPKVCYLISKPLVLRSFCKLTLPRYAEIRLAPDSNCVMLKNETKDSYAKRSDSKLFGSYLNYYSPDAPCQNIAVEGGVWNFNNKNQNPNPLSNGKYEPEGYSGFGFLFYNVQNLAMSNLTLKDPCNFAVTMDTVSYFDIHDITFDYNDGNLYQSNMDGIHLCGNCHHGNLERLFGTCYDDIVALNAHEGSCGPITDITVSKIYTQEAYSAVRLLSASKKSPIKNVHICDIYGTFYHFCVAMMHFYETGEQGVLENITIDNIYASKSSRDKVKFYLVHKYRKYGIIDASEELDIKNLCITNLHRCEKVDITPTIWFFENTNIQNLILKNITCENKTNEKDMPLLQIDCDVKEMSLSMLFENGKAIE